MKSATTALLDQICTSQSCSDYRAAQLLDVGRSAVSRWRTTDAHMGAALIARACELACEPDVFRWQAFIGAERDKGPDGDFWREVRAEFLALDAKQPPQKDWYLYPFIKGLGGLVPALLLACIGIAASSKTLAASVDESTLYADQSIHYANRLRRRAGQNRRRVRRFLGLIFPAWDSGTMEPLQLSAA